MKIICPKCSAEKKISLVESSYTCPQRCWKCHELFLIKIKNDVLVSCQPLCEEDFKKLEEINALKNKFRKP